MAERRYDDKEVGEILKSAANMQTGLVQARASEGMTLAELQRVAAEIGIDPVNIGFAAGDLDAQRAGKARPGTSSVMLERTVNGELSDEAWEEMVTSLRRSTGRAGQLEASGVTREWRANSDLESFMFSATTRNGQTRLRLLGNTGGSTGLVTVMGAAFGFAGTLATMVRTIKAFVTVNPLIVAIVTLFVACLCVFVTKSINRAIRKKFGILTESLFAELTAAAEAGGIAARAPQPSGVDRALLASANSDVSRLDDSAVSQATNSVM